MNDVRGQRGALLVTKMVELLAKVPLADRARFARVQLTGRHRALVDAFDAIPENRRNKTVLFASHTPHTRETRLAAAVRSAGWDVVGLCVGKPKYDPASFFNFHIVVDDAIELTLAAWLFPGTLVHSFALRGDHAGLIGRLKPRRLVLDFYDLCADSASADTSSKLLERDIIARADGITHRDLRMKKLQRHHGYSLPQNNILVHDPLPPAVIKQRTKNAAGIHVVSSGWVGTGANSILRVAKALVADGVHLHIYLNPFQQGESADTEPYRRLAKESTYLHVEQPVYGPAYLQALSQYDFGLAIVEPAVFGEKIEGFTTDSIAGCGSSRLCDYIAAGLGVISSPQLRFQHFWARRYADATVPATATFLRNPRAALEAALQMSSNQAPIDRSAISIEGTAIRLVKFYERICSATTWVGTYDRVAFSPP